MNRYNYLQIKPKRTCCECGEVISRFEKCYIVSKKRRMCVSCRNAIIQRVDTDASHKRDFSNLWLRKKSASKVFPELLFFDGKLAFDFQTKESVAMKDVDINLYYSRMTNEIEA